ncbi:MAG: ABC transporter permease [Elusimicrobiales bacterium]|jgi:peptide/nickel transport system permease protein|nr:ABC transporter permease [Elusimicrobiales bacterium]NLH39577.1 ABC transporter permease [Elusimicrobiota bacterium]
MKKFITRRLFLIPLTFIGITLILFAIINILPPETLATSYATSDKELTKTEINEIVKKYGLDKPVIERYFKWLANTFKGDMGYSQVAKLPTTKAIINFLPATIELTLFSVIPIFFIGNILGLISAVRKDSITDKIIRFFASLFYSMPSFVIGIFLLLIFYGVLGIFEPQRYSIDTDMLILNGSFVKYTNFMIIDSVLNLNLTVFMDTLKHLFLPATAIFLGTSASFIKITRTSTLEELNKDYVRTLRAKGLEEKYIINKHIRKNILIPQLTIGGLQLIRLLSGVVIIETIFDWPGIGSWGVKCAGQLDISGVMGFAIVVSVLFLIGNLLIDILYAVVDPRIRYD